MIGQGLILPKRLKLEGQNFREEGLTHVRPKIMQVIYHEKFVNFKLYAENNLTKSTRKQQL